jgi:hypothetical protein
MWVMRIGMPLIINRILTSAEWAPLLGSLFMNELLIPNARRYALRKSLEICGTLGSGKDGIVLVGKLNSETSRVAIKILRFHEQFLREKRVYERLSEMRVTSVLGFNVPKLIGSDESLQVLEMTVVERPFVLDFAGAYLDKRPEFSAEIWADWEAEKREQFEDRWISVQKILGAFESFGIYLMDVSPGNIAFGR